MDGRGGPVNEATQDASVYNIFIGRGRDEEIAARPVIAWKNYPQYEFLSLVDRVKLTQVKLGPDPPLVSRR